MILAAALPAMPLRCLRRSGIGLRMGSHWCRTGAASVLALRGLSRVGSQKTVFERRAVKAADNGLHLIGRRCVDECEPFGLLRLVVANDFYGIGYKVFRCQPLLNVVSSDPRGEIAKKYGKAHSVG